MTWWCVRAAIWHWCARRPAIRIRMWCGAARTAKKCRLPANMVYYHPSYRTSKLDAHIRVEYSHSWTSLPLYIYIVNVVDGELLQIIKVSRLHMAAYLCVASNAVAPSISKRVQLRVQCMWSNIDLTLCLLGFNVTVCVAHYLSKTMCAVPPMLSIPNQLEGAYLGQDVTLECHTEAYPASINYWTTDRGDMIISGMSTLDRS